MQSCNNDDKVFFTMDLLNGNGVNNANKNSEVQTSSAPPVNTGVSDDDFIITPPDQSNIVIPKEMIFVRKPVNEDSTELNSLVDDDTGVSETSNNSSSDDDEFVYKEPQKVAPVDDAFVFIRKKAPSEDAIEFEDSDIIAEESVEESPTNVAENQIEKSVDGNLVVTDNKVDEIAENDSTYSSEDDYVADSLAFLGLDGVDEDDDDYDLFGFEDLDDDSEEDILSESIIDENDNTNETDIAVDSESNITDSIIDSDIDGEILYKSEDTKYNENKYHSDNIIRDYEEDNKYNYPLLYLTGEKIELFRVQALTGMLDKRSFIDTDELYYHVYVDVDGSVVYLGKLLSKLLRTVLNNQTFSTFNKKVYLNKDTSYEGDLLYALSELDISLLS